MVAFEQYTLDRSEQNEREFKIHKAKMIANLEEGIKNDGNEHLKCGIMSAEDEKHKEKCDDRNTMITQVPVQEQPKEIPCNMFKIEQEINCSDKISSYAQLAMCDPCDRLETIFEAIKYLKNLPFLPEPTPT